jgi:hypothetical protein
MMTSEVDDYVFQEDPTVIKLQEKLLLLLVRRLLFFVLREPRFIKLPLEFLISRIMN